MYKRLISNQLQNDIVCFLHHAQIKIGIIGFMVQKRFFNKT